MQSGPKICPFFTYEILVLLVKKRSKSTFQPMKVCSTWVCLEASWVDSACFYAFYEGVCYFWTFLFRFYRPFWAFLDHFDPVWGYMGPFLDHFWTIFGPFLAIFDDFWLFLGKINFLRRKSNFDPKIEKFRKYWRKNLFFAPEINFGPKIKKNDFSHKIETIIEILENK